MHLMKSFLAVLCCAAIHAGEYKVLGETWNGHPPSEMMTHYLKEKTRPYIQARKEKFEALKSPEDIAAYQEMQRKYFQDQLGEWPERTPLNAHVTGQGEGVGFRYEKVIFESRPGLHVTAVLFLPTTPGPYPAVLVPCGHDMDGKAKDTYQSACILLAQNGMAAFCYDPVSQGERLFFTDTELADKMGSTVDHSLMNVGSVLLGSNIAAYHIWDGMRALDYLETRPDIDKERFGCTGNSGGGTVTSYIMALDPRIKVAAPSCYITSMERLLDTIGPQDGEQNIFGQVKFGMDHADYIHMRAPNPTLILAATGDFFDIQGTWDTFREGKRLYGLLGYPERMDLVEWGTEHGYNKVLREGAVRWMKRWLLGVDEPVVEPALTLLTLEQMRCTPDGFTKNLPGAKSVFDINAAYDEERKPQRTNLWKDAALEEYRAMVAGMVGADPNDAQAMPLVEVLATEEMSGYTLKMVALSPEPGIVLPSLLLMPKGEVKDVVLYCAGADKATEIATLQEWATGGAAVLAVDLRGIGETESFVYGQGTWPYVGADWPDHSRAYLIGESIVGMRVKDIWSATAYLSEAVKGAPIRLIATGEATVPALHAAALHGSLFSHTTLRGGIPSWSEVVHMPQAKDQLVNAIHGALESYDLPELLALAGPDRVTVEDARVPAFQ